MTDLRQRRPFFVRDRKEKEDMATRLIGDIATAEQVSRRARLMGGRSRSRSRSPHRGGGKGERGGGVSLLVRNLGNRVRCTPLCTSTAVGGQSFRSHTNLAETFAWQARWSEAAIREVITAP